MKTQTLVILLIFDAVILILGAVILINAAGMHKSGKVPELFLNEYEQKKLDKKKESAFAKKLFPAAVLFGIVDLYFGVEGFLSVILSFPRLVDIISVGIFLFGWFFFTVCFRRVKAEFIPVV